MDFFEKRGHRIVPSSSVIPHGDPTLLFTNAGMNQFKDVFLGTGKRDYVRAADTQKCIRVSGKHNDLEEVGRDTYHHTFFEMLGNWSFGDYYKKEAIGWAWELLTSEWGLEKRRLYATVYETDDEAFELWKKVTDIDPTHVLKFGKKDNFWEMGETGPCGPCSEIHIDMTADYSGGNLVNAGDARVMEIWNLVFIQNNRNEKGELENLPAKHVDTGMGFERVCAILQGKNSNYDTDVFMPIINKIAQTVGKEYTSLLDSPKDIAMRVVADHIRMLTFSITDGAIPGNEGRGYVLRRILRRAARFGRNLGMREPFIYKITSAVVESMGKAFPEIVKKQAHVERVIKSEEESFNQTLDRGLNEFSSIVANTVLLDLIGTHIDVEYEIKDDVATYYSKQRKKISEISLNENIEKQTGKVLTIHGKDAFKLYDTYGFPLDLTELMAEERGLKVDVSSFSDQMEAQRKRSQLNRKKTYYTQGYGFGGKPTYNEDRNMVVYPPDLRKLRNGDFIYENLMTEAHIEVEFDDIVHLDKTQEMENDSYLRGIILDRTTFYYESGGQVSDTGFLSLKHRDSSIKLEVMALGKDENRIIHLVKPDISLKQFWNSETTVVTEIDVPRRVNVQRNHSATHLVHEALRRVLGAHVHQQGSLVAPDHLRFDFPHFGKISPEEVRAIEQMVNAKIAEDIGVFTEVDMPIEKAKKIPNVKMFFGEKYGDIVRVVFIDENYSVEFCGGTHVKNTNDIGLFKIISESSIASGVRRIEAVTGEGVQKYIDDQLLKAKHLGDQIAKFIEEKEILERELNKYAGKSEISQRPSLGTISLPSNQSESIQLLEKELTKREQIAEQVSKQTLDIKKELSKYKVKEASSGIESLIAGARSVNGFKIVASRIEAATMDELKSIGDTLRSKLGSGVGVLASIIEDKVALVCVVTDDLIKNKNLQAGKIVGEMAKQVGGGGGGKPHLATAGGKDIAKLDETLQNTTAVVQKMVSQ